MSIAGVVLTLLGCASDHPPPPRPQRADRHIERVLPGRFDLARALGTGRPVVRVTLERSTEVAERNRVGLSTAVGGAAGLTALGLGVAAEGILLVPAFASAGVIGGAELVIIAPILIVAGAAYDAQVKRVSAILTEVDLPGRLQTSLADRLAARASSADTRGTVEISIAGYGFTAAAGTAPAPTCFTLAADLRVRDGERELFADQIFVEPFRRSVDLPPPRCATLRELAENGGKLAREILDESSHVVAAAVVKRLGGVQR